jgi:hypothetical protein
MHVALVQELSPDSLPCPAFEQDIIRDNDGSPAILLEQRLDVLQEVQLLVRGRGPKVVSLVGLFLLRDLAFLAHDGNAALLAKGRLGQDDVEPLARNSGNSVGEI